MRSIASFLFNRRCDTLEAALHHCFTKRWCGPGLWTALVVLSRTQNQDAQQVLRMLDKESALEYGKAIGIEAALGLEDTYSYNRTNQGANYSPLVILDGEDKVDGATRDIGGCIRTWFNGSNLERFAAELCDVVGDLHDNVWSHAKSTGISMAQKWQSSQADSAVLEFALADGGMGFLRELIRSGITRREGIEDPADAIRWCIVRGNSSKLREEDPWVQRLPSDAMGNPMGPIARIKDKENNHLGLGLAKLVDLVLKFKGTLWLASSNAILTIDGKGGTKYQHFPFQWQGVLLSCRFDVATVEQVVASHVGNAAPDEIDALISSLISG